MEQQSATAKFGMWIFLVTEIMFFGGMFASYLIYRLSYYNAWVAGSRTMEIQLRRRQHGGAHLLIADHGDGRAFRQAGQSQTDRDFPVC